MFLQAFFLLIIISISCIHCQENIKCGETKKGNREIKEEVKFTFNALNDYDQVYLEGCQSTHDIWLEIFNSAGDCIASVDDQNEHGGECENRFAGDITIPGDVKRDEQYTFVVKGYRLRHGYYSVTLVCEEEEEEDDDASSPGYPTSTSTEPPTTSTTTESPTTSTTTEPPTTSTTTTTTTEPPIEDDNEECFRIRRPWHLLNENERNLFINGFRELKRIGKLDFFTRTHGNSSIQKHGNAGFLPWHRYFIWELETQIRNLGDEYECFGLPYWDWSHDIEQHEFNVAEWQILKSGLGGAGNKYNNYCVENDGWDSNNYKPYYDNCLRRKVCGESGEESCSPFLGQASALHSLLSVEPKYGDDDKDYDYRYRLELKHGSAHVRIGGSGDDGGHLGSLQRSTDDPIFYLIHAFVDFQYALWQDCRNHELVSKDYITRDMYDGQTYKLDDYLDFGILSNQNWYSEHDVTVRDMHSIQDWDVIYDKGDYFERAAVENDGSICRESINQDWFEDITGTTKRRRRLQSDNEEYSRDVFAKISTKYGCGKSSTTDKKAELYKTWAQMDCQFLTIGNNCGRPKYFDDGSDIEPNRYVEGTGQYDIDITLEELKSKVADYPCMIETREMYYSWAKQVGNLKGLARGDYDRFCDHEFVSKQFAEQKCAANQFKKEKGKGKGKDKW